MLYIDGIIFALQSSGGISICFRELLNGLEKNKFNYKFLSYGGNKLFSSDMLSRENIIKHKSFMPLALERYMDVKIPKTASIFHSSYYRIPLQSNVKAITTVHDFTYEKYYSGLRRKIHHTQKKRAVLNSDIVICISESTKRDLHHFIPESKSMDVRVILNGVSPDYYVLKDINETSPYVLYVGARAGYKNFSALINALTIIPSMRLLSVGGGPLSDEEISVLEKCLPHRYSHKSFVSNNELNFLYNHAFCFVYPSLYEGFGIPVLEAMKAGCPVVAARSSSIPEVCGDAALLLDDVNPDLLAQAINQLFKTSVRSHLIEKGLENASKFSWEVNTSNIINVYKEMIEGTLR